MTFVLPRLSETYVLKRFVFIEIYLLYLHSILSVTSISPHFGLDFLSDFSDKTEYRRQCSIESLDFGLGIEVSPCIFKTMYADKTSCQ